MKVEAYDEKGNRYTKEVTIGTAYDGTSMIDFGWPCQYMVNRLEKNYPFDKPLCIDIGGRNHKGIPDVCVSAEDVNRIFRELLGYK